MSMADWRLPGNATSRLVEYRCPDDDDQSEWSEAVPRCPVCGKLMIPVEDPYAERRRKLRGARKK
jgi:hypothetical protein